MSKNPKKIKLPKNISQINPSDLLPDSVQYLLVGIMRKNEFNYYVLPRILLYLDFRAYLLERYPYCAPEEITCEGADERFYIYTVDEDHEDYYMQCITPYKWSCERLKEHLQICLDKYEASSYFPCILIDFDRKSFLSYYWEPYFFDKYVPAGWTSEFRPIKDEDVPANKRFWIEADGTDIFLKLAKEDK